MEMLVFVPGESGSEHEVGRPTFCEEVPSALDGLPMYFALSL